MVQFVGRERELAAARDLLVLARRGRPQPLLVSGVAGCGKSVLLDVLAEDAASDGFCVLHLTGGAGDGASPFLALRLALPGWTAVIERALAGDGSPVVDALDRLLADHEATERVPVMDEVRRLLEALAFRRPVLVLVDDLHLLDPATADVVLHVMRHLRRHRVAVIAAERTDGGWHGAADDLRRARDAGHVDEVELGPFDDTEVSALVVAHLGRPPDDHLLDLLRRRTGGMPFFTDELVRALATTALEHHEDGTMGTRDGDDVPLPRRAATAVLHRVFLLGADARRVATAAALLEHIPADRFGTLATVCGLGGDRVDDAFDRLVRAGVLVGDGATYRFQHAIVREALLADLHPAARRRMHGAVAGVLADERRAGEVRGILEIGEHLRRAVPGRDPTAAALLVEAGDELADAAPRRAAEWYRLALARLSADDLAAAHVQVRLGRVLAVGGRPDEAHLVAVAALRRLPPGRERDEAVAVAGRASLAAGRIDEAVALVDAAVGEAGRPEPGLLLDHAQIRSWSGDVTSAVALADAARARGAAADHPAVLTVALHDALDRGAFRQAATVLTRLGAVTADASAASRRAAAWTRCVVGAAHFDPSAVIVEAGAVGDDEPLAGWFRAASAWALWRLGRLDEATAAAGAARCLVASGSADVTAGPVVQVLVRAHLERGEVERAVEVVGWAETLPTAALGSGLDLARARLLGARGDHDAAAGLQRRAVAREDRNGRAGPLVDALSEQIDGAALAGRQSVVRAVNRRLQEIPCDGGSVAMATAKRLAAALAGPDRDLALDARDHAASAGLALDAARCLARAGEVASDVDLLAAAHAELGRLGAVVRQRAVAARLRALGRRPVASRPATAGTLTPTELEVAMLVADGSTNRQVAAAMNLSPKTIEVYLSRVYAKTACRSRVELAVAVRSGTLRTSA